MEYSLKNFVISENLKDTTKSFYSSNVIGRNILSSYDLVMDHFKNCHSQSAVHQHNHSTVVANDMNIPVIYENQEESDIYFNYNSNAALSNHFSGKFVCTYILHTSLHMLKIIDFEYYLSSLVYLMRLLLIETTKIPPVYDNLMTHVVCFLTSNNC